MYLTGSWRKSIVVAAFAISACGGGGSSSPPPPPPPPPAPVTKTVTFNANGATGTAPAPLIFTVGQNAQIPTADLTATNYTFAGWNTRADGTGTAFAAAAAANLGAADLTLYAQFKAAPLKVTQTGGADDMRLVVEWYDGSKQDIVFRPDLVGFGTDYHFTSVVGGLAVLATGGTHYTHTSAPSDYAAGHAPVMTVTSGVTALVQAVGPRAADRQGALAATNAATTLDELKFVVKGRLTEADADTEVEITLRADAPRMALTRSKITYTRPTSIDRIYHQGVYANPAWIGDPLSYLYVKNGWTIDTTAPATDLTAGFFYKNEPHYYVGFLAPRSDVKDFYSWRIGGYFAAYKILYDNVVKNAGDSSVSRLVSTFGFDAAEARTYLSWAQGLHLGNKPDLGQLPIAQRGAARAITEAFTAQ